MFQHSMKLLGSAAVAALIAAPANAAGINVPAGGLKDALSTYAAQTGVHVFYAESLIKGATTKGVKGNLPAEEALSRILAGTGLMPHIDSGVVEIIRGERSSDVQPFTVPSLQLAQAAPAHSPVVETVTVTSSKLGGGDVQSIPIAITTLTQEQLAEQKIEGGPDLLRSVPNMTFTKTNFASYNVQIRGIGTQAISATTDPGVAVSFNDVGLIHNRLFEQEFFDVERVEVLRGPQGTLYGRNATGGVINITSAKPKLDSFEGMIKGEVGNFDSKRMSGMLNLPVIDDMLAVRLAGSLTKRDGYDYNSVTRNRVNGRDLWSLRGTVGFQPAPWLRGNVVWERFREEDNRSRTGKQLCHRDDSPDMVGSMPTREANPSPSFVEFQEQRAALFSTGCKPGSLYDDAAFGTPNGLALNNVAGVNTLGALFSLGWTPDGQTVGLLNPTADPYGGMMQSRNLREIASFRDPIYRAKSDVVELNLNADIAPNLTLFSQTALNWDSVYSFQDYNRFNTFPIFTDTSALRQYSHSDDPSPYRDMAPGGVLCDPQIGCSKTMGAFDLSSAASKQFSQEVRVQSGFSGRFNFSAGLNYTRFKTQDDYYVMSNLFTALAMMSPNNTSANQSECGWGSFFSTVSPPVPIENSACVYVDPNPVEQINGQGHNYFRSSNPYELKSWAGFGEAYYNVTPDIKLTGGLRYTRDRKVFTPVPTQLLLAPSIVGGGYVGTGYPADPDIKQVWGEWTGRFVADWAPQLSFTDQTLVFASYSHGYKAGGANPPSPGFATTQQLLDLGLITQSMADLYIRLGALPVLKLTGVNYTGTFEPEFVNAFELGTKNTLLDGRLMLDGSFFFYDYTNYQVSEVRDRTAVNENFDAKLWGSEMSARLEVFSNFRLTANVGYLGTRLADGQKSIDPMNRNLGNRDYTVFKPWVQLPSNCVVPTPVAEAWLQRAQAIQYYWQVCGGVGGILGLLGGRATDPATGQAYDSANYPELNGGAGLATDLSGKELPNSPHWTVNFGAEYTIAFADDWAATIRGDLYWQAQSWWRVYNLAPYDRLEPWSNVNFTVHIDGPNGLALEAYVKNAFNNTALTGAFLNGDDSGLTTNVFTSDPRLIGFSITKSF